MTIEQLRHHFNIEFFDRSISQSKSVPSTFEVDAETYLNVVQYIFKEKATFQGTQNLVTVALGKNNCIMYKGIELILKSEGKT